MVNYKLNPRIFKESWRTRTIKFPIFGEMTLVRPYYRQRESKEFRALVDEKLGYQANIQLSEEGRNLIITLPSSKQWLRNQPGN